MFDNYNEIDPQYVPNNENKCCRQSILYQNKPYEEYNAQHELVGYWWNYGDTVNLQIDFSGEITVEDNAIIYAVAGEGPTIKTAGVVGQKAYNVINLVSWTCIVSAIDTFIWVEDEKFDYSLLNSVPVYFELSQFMKDKTIRVSIYDFRFKEIYNEVFDGTTLLAVPISSELSNTMVRGTYYMNVVVCDEVNNDYVTVLNNVSLTVK